MKFLSSKNRKNAVFGGFFMFSGRDLHVDDIRKYLIFDKRFNFKRRKHLKMLKKSRFFEVKSRR